MTNSRKPLEELSPKERQEMIKRSEERRKLMDGGRRPMIPDRDFTWENTNFEGYEND